ncbi:DUF3592 domain-containing protein [Nannocystis punicea]|uniref:DUF3592 domain-containing protein n=1 Tax=Nannocystis punicea TaxID=2995304 RepID=A0ABY7GSQ1_9BACT|nr:DUF3592 domain-containing protein [Nannocystis poenicansa]WAS89985.1 DUF3592 domain-containing protein [Nannocystis poenicansa]
MTRFDIVLMTSMGLLGLVTVGLTLWVLRRTRALLVTGERVLGRPARSQHRVGTGDGAAQYDVVEFMTKDGQSGRTMSRLGMKWSTQDLSIPVIYDPSNPKHAVIDHKFELWGAPVLMLFMGVVVVLVPVGVVVTLYAIGRIH